MNQNEVESERIDAPRGNEGKNKKDFMIREILAKEGIIESQQRQNSFDQKIAGETEKAAEPDFFYTNEHVDDLKQLQSIIAKHPIFQFNDLDVRNPIFKKQGDLSVLLDTDECSSEKKIHVFSSHSNATVLKKHV